MQPNWQSKLRTTLLLLIIGILSFKTNAQTLHVKSIKYVGLKRTRPETLNRILNLQNQSLKAIDSSFLIANAEKDLYNTKLFTKVSHYSKVENDELNITFKVVERWYTYAIPYFDLIDKNFNEWWVTRDHKLNRIIIGADFTQKNTTGRNDDFKLSFLGGNQNKLVGEYRLTNYLVNGRFGLSIKGELHAYRNFNYSSENNQLQYLLTDEIAFRRNQLSTSILYHPSFSKYSWFSLGYQTDKVGSQIIDKNSDYFGVENTNSLQLFFTQIGYKLDKRDLRGYARSGFLFYSQLSSHFFPNESSLNFSQIDLRFVRHIPFGKKCDLALSSIAKLSRDKARPYYLNRGLGWGVNSIRAYDYFALDGSSFFAQKASIRFRAYDQKIHFKNFPIKSFKILPFKAAPKVFFDVAYVKNTKYSYQGDFLNRPVYATGVGLDLIFFDDAVWRVEYAINHTSQASFFINFTSAIQ